MTMRYPARRALFQALGACALGLSLPGAHATEAASAQTVRRLSDGSMDCRALSAEATALQERIGVLQAESAVLQQRLSKAQAGLMDDLPTMGGGSALAGSLLSLVPGGDLIAGVGAAAAAQAQQRQVMEVAAQMQDMAEKVAAVEIQLDHARQRHDHLVGLYLAKSCKAP